MAPAASSIPRTWGGYYYNIGSGIAVDGSGNAYVTGATWSDDFPTTPSAYQGTITAGAKDGNVFVTKINTLGSGTSSLVYSTYLGGSGSEEGKGIAVDGSGNAYITGNTSSSDFPTTPSAYKGTTDDVFVAKIDTLGSGASSLVYSTYLGGSDGELGSGIAVDGSGNAYITGLTDSTNFPTTPSAYQGTLQGTYYGDRDAFVSKLSLPPELPNAITLVYFHASAGKDGSVTLTWETATEVDNAGFNLYRSRKKDGDYKKINDTLIPAMGNATTGAKYSYTDTPPAKGTYYYKLEDVDYNGISTMHGQEKVKVKIMSGDAGTKKSKRKKGR
ncbi:MAG: SBBP repeat-containing protein [Candidatus Brocadia sp.]|nr:SBBP repeat-containing protein [Candidatus Brocadia sp.]